HYKTFLLTLKAHFYFVSEGPTFKFNLRIVPVSKIFPERIRTKLLPTHSYYFLTYTILYRCLALNVYTEANPVENTILGEYMNQAKTSQLNKKDHPKALLRQY